MWEIGVAKSLTLRVDAIQQARQRGPAIPALAGEHLEHLAFVINGSPQVVRIAIDPDEHLIQVPTPPRI